MTLSPDQKMAYNIVKLYLQHGLNDEQRKKLTLDKIMDSYYYALGRVRGRVDSDPFKEDYSFQNQSEESETSTAPSSSSYENEEDALSSNPSAFSFLD